MKTFLVATVTAIVVSFSLFISQTFNGLECFAHRALTYIIPQYMERFVPYLRPEVNLDEDHVITQTNEGWPIVVNKHDRCVCRAIRLCGMWEQKSHQIILDIVNPGDTVIEVGANYGIHLISLAKKVGSKGKVYAYEANPYVSNALKRTVSLNGLDQIYLRNFAIGEKHSSAVLNFNYQNIGGGAVDFNQRDVTDEKFSKKVTVVSLDEDLSNLENVSLLRMDIEGSEGPALYGADKLFDKSPNIKLIIEWSPELLKKNTSLKKLISFLKSKGFKHFYQITPDNFNKIELEALLNVDFADILITKTPYLKANKL